MFKGYLRIRSKFFQLSVFLFLWAGFYLILAFLQVALIHHFFGVNGKKELSDFAAHAMSTHPDFVIWTNTLFTLLVFGLPAFLFAYLAHPKPLPYLGLHQVLRKSQWIWIILIAVGMIPIISGIGDLMSSINLGSTAHKLQELRDSQINAYLSGIGGWELVRNVVLLALLPAFCEELLFRGVIQKFAFSYLKNAPGAILISAFLFALMHQSIYSFVPIFLAGIILAWIYQQTQCLWLNVTTHFLFNGLQVVASFFIARKALPDSITENNSVSIVIVVVGLILLIAGILMLSKLRTPYTKAWNVEERDDALFLN